MTESGAWGSLNAPALFPGNDGRWQGGALACRFLNDLNHGVDTWVWFIGAWIMDTQMMGGKTDCEQGCGKLCGENNCGNTRQEDMKLISTCPGAAEKPCYNNSDYSDATGSSGNQGNQGNGSQAGAPQYYQLMPQYHYAKQLRQAFDIGCVLRSATTNSTVLPSMTWTYVAVKHMYHRAV